jgi:hypothetical protein
MSEPENEEKWLQARVINRWEAKNWPYYGTIVQHSYPFLQVCDYIATRHLAHESLVLKTLLTINTRSQPSQNQYQML